LGRLPPHKPHTGLSHVNVNYALHPGREPLYQRPNPP